MKIQSFVVASAIKLSRGNVTAYVTTRAKVAKVASVKIEGKCFSRCTMFTSLPNACVMPDARIGSHGTSPSVPLLQRGLDMRLGRYYRRDVRRLNKN